MKLNHIALYCMADDRREEAGRLAEALGIPLLEDMREGEYELVLVVTKDKVGVAWGERNSKLEKQLVSVDFLSKTLLHRIQQISFRKELLARAIGIKPALHPRIVDATAGLGRDSFILAAIGYDVTLIEKSGILHAMLEDGIKRGKQHAKAAPILDRLHLVHADSCLWLNKLPPNERPEVVYLDPMFPERKKSASVKKEMVILQHLLETEDNLEDLFQSALSCATRRVVVKRPRLAANIAARAPNFSISGTSSRFDIYLV